jgi:hypothetical protein
MNVFILEGFYNINFCFIIFTLRIVISARGYPLCLPFLWHVFLHQSDVVFLLTDLLEIISPAPP